MGLNLGKSPMDSYVEMSVLDLRGLCERVIEHVPVARERRRQSLIDARRIKVERVGFLWRILGLKKRSPSDDEVWRDLNADSLGEASFLGTYGNAAEEIARKLLAACRHGRLVSVSASDLKTLDDFAGPASVESYRATGTSR